MIEKQGSPPQAVPSIGKAWSATHASNMRKSIIGMNITRFAVCSLADGVSGRDRGRMKRCLFVVVLPVLSSPGYAQQPDCKSIPDPKARLECFDTAPTAKNGGLTKRFNHEFQAPSLRPLPELAILEIELFSVYSTYCLVRESNMRQKSGQPRQVR